MCSNASATAGQDIPTPPRGGAPIVTQSVAVDDQFQRAAEGAVQRVHLIDSVERGLVALASVGRRHRGAERGAMRRPSVGQHARSPCARTPRSCDTARMPWPRTAIYSKVLPFVRPALANGAAGSVVAPHGRVLSMMAFTVTNGRIVQIHALLDQHRAGLRSRRGRSRKMRAPRRSGP
jgi:hypothetical protein